jgi:hypothetical protein
MGDPVAIGGGRAFVVFDDPPFVFEDDLLLRFFALKIIILRHHLGGVDHGHGVVWWLYGVTSCCEE